MDAQYRDGMAYNAATLLAREQQARPQNDPQTHLYKGGTTGGAGEASASPLFYLVGHCPTTF